ncbi:MAG: hypothetical protein JWM36_2268 [Hyphomicrobiales bacterium]|nr:hypothetical protein [Hyphomicrobiales bacterium]
MATPARIIVHCSDAKWRNIYLHFDGHLCAAGAKLHHHYSTQRAAEALVAMGGLSSLAQTLASSEFFNRDLGRKLEILTRVTLDQAWADDEHDVAYTYLWHDGAWHGNESCEPMLRFNDALIAGFSADEAAS